MKRKLWCLRCPYYSGLQLDLSTPILPLERLTLLPASCNFLLHLLLNSRIQPVWRWLHWLQFGCISIFVSPRPPLYRIIYHRTGALPVLPWCFIHPAPRTWVGPWTHRAWSAGPYPKMSGLPWCYLLSHPRILRLCLSHHIHVDLAT